MNLSAEALAKLAQNHAALGFGLLSRLRFGKPKGGGVIVLLIEGRR